MWVFCDSECIVAFSVYGTLPQYVCAYLHFVELDFNVLRCKLVYFVDTWINICLFVHVCVCVCVCVHPTMLLVSCLLIAHFSILSATKSFIICHSVTTAINYLCVILYIFQCLHANENV